MCAGRPDAACLRMDRRALTAMLTILIFSIISVLWLVAGASMMAAPAWWCEQLIRKLADPFSRFLILQGTVLAGILMVLGASEPQRSWFWMVIGAVMAAKALVLLGLNETRRERLLTWWKGRPAWFHRVAGLATVALAALLAIDAVRWR